MYAQNVVKVLIMTNFRFAGRVTKVSQRCNATVFHLRQKSYRAEPIASSGKVDTSSDSNLPFARSRVGSFFQAQPELRNQFLEDVTLQKYLRRHIPNKVV